MPSTGSGCVADLPAKVDAVEERRPTAVRRVAKRCGTGGRMAASKAPQAKNRKLKTTGVANEARANDEAPAGKPRSIFLFADGTGNSSAKLFKTNVWRMYEAIDL